jgi:hypothetical protein
MQSKLWEEIPFNHILGGAKMASIGKKHAEVLKLVDNNQLYSVEEAVELVKKNELCQV